MKRKNKKTQKSRKKRTQAIQYAMHQPSLTPPANRLYTDRLRIAISEAVDYCIAHDILGDFLKKHRSEVIAVTLYEYSEEEHRRIQERDKAELKEQLAEAKTNLRQSNAKLQQSETKLAQSNAELQQSKDKLSQAIHNTIAMLQSMGCDDSFICAKLCEIYQISETSAMIYLQK